MKFKSDIEVQAGLKDSSGAAGTSGQVLSSDGTAVSWIDAEIGVARDVQNRVKAGVAINKGQAVYVTGADGTNIIVGLASNTSEATSSKTLGLLNATVATNGFADVVQIGKLTGLNTIGAVVGDPVWLGTNGNLIYGLTNKPYAPAHLVYIGVVTRVNASNGEIFVTVQNGFELKEIHDVDIITTTPTNGDVLGYNGSLWVNKTIPGWLGYTPANDANVVHITGSETITGAKTFTTAITIDKATANTDALLLKVGGNQQGRITINNDGGFDLFTSTDNSGYGINFDANDSNGILFYADNPSMPKFIVGDSYNNSQQDLYSTKFIKNGGTSNQYLKADGSVSTAMNSRIEVNFIATAGQTTFVTPYEVGQVDIYYNGSKLYPNEFTATNGTDIILATGATLNAQISIVKYVSSLSTTAIRNETTFTTTAGQTTFSVNYSVGQVDVFYNGSKLNISEFTATNGTSVVLGFACVAGESIVIDSYVNQISGASGTANKVAKFTGAASLGDSSISDNGTVVSLTNSDSRLYGGDNVGRFIIGNPSVTTYLAIYGSSHATLPNFSQIIVNNLQAISMFASGNVFIGSSPVDAGYKLDVNGTGRYNTSLTIGAGGLAGRLSVRGTTNDSSAYSFEAANSSGNSLLLVRNDGNVGINTTPSTKMHIAGSASTGGVLRVDNDQNQGDVNHGIINLVNTKTYASGNDASMMFSAKDSGGTIHPRASIGMKVSSASTSGDLVFNTRNDSTYAERMRINSNGNVGIGNGANVNARLHVEGQDIYLTGATDNRIRFSNFGFTGNSMGAAIGYAYRVANTQESGSLVFYTNPNTTGTPSLTERMRITSDGFAKFSNTGSYFNLANNQYIFNTDVSNLDSLILSSSATTPFGMWFRFTSSPNNASSYFAVGSDGTETKFLIFSNGSMVNRTGSYGTISDIKYKENIKDASSKLDDILKLKVRNFNFIGNETKQIGFIAQEFEEVFPNMIDVSTEKAEEGKEPETYKSIKTSVLTPILVKAMQELVEQVKELKAEIEILKNK